MHNIKQLSRLRKWVKLWNEGPVSIILLLAFLYSPVVLHRLDPESGSFDLGYLHVIVLALLLFYVCGFVAWNGFRLNFPLLFREFAECNEQDIVNNNDTGRTWRVFFFSLAIYFGYMVLLLVLMLAVLFSVPR